MVQKVFCCQTDTHCETAHCLWRWRIKPHIWLLYKFKKQTKTCQIRQNKPWISMLTVQKRSYMVCWNRKILPSGQLEKVTVTVKWTQFRTKCNTDIKVLLITADTLKQQAANLITWDECERFRRTVSFRLRWHTACLFMLYVVYDTYIPVHHESNGSAWLVFSEPFS